MKIMVRYSTHTVIKTNCTLGLVKMACSNCSMNHQSRTWFIGLKLRNLINELASVVAEYYTIGVQLGISVNKLQEFEENYSLVNRRFSAVISYWLKGNTEPVTWESLITALESPSVGEETLANELREKYIKPREIIQPGIVTVAMVSCRYSRSPSWRVMVHVC